MLKRTFSTIALWTVVIGLLYLFGVHAGVWLLTFFAVATQYEFYGLLAKMGHRPFSKTGCFLGAMMFICPFYMDRLTGFLPDILSSYLASRMDPMSLPGAILVLAVLIFAIRILKERDAETRVGALATSLFGLLYVPYMLQFFVRIILIYDNPEEGTIPMDGLYLALWVIAVSKFCDVGALLSGMAFGKHKMAPGISPKKTWEGAVGGIIISIGIGSGLAWAYNTYAPNDTPENFTPLIAALIAAPIAVVAIISDLIESVIKRRADIKDTGAVIPGIGGMFDLTDSLILTAPLGYALFLFLPL